MEKTTDTYDASILIIDDNPVNLRFVELLLNKEGYNTICSHDPMEVIEIASLKEPDLILLDITMPQMSGLEVCRLLKGNDRTTGIPIIFVTANTDDQTLKEAFAAGGNDYVKKPLNREELLARIRACLREKALVDKLVQQERLTAVLETAGAVCHEMNQPLQFLTWASSELLEGLPSESPLKEQATSIKSHVERLSEIVKKLANITTYKVRHYVKGHSIIDLDRASMP